MLDLLRAVAEPLGAAEVAERLGVHANTARFHLDALVSQGVVERGSEDRSGPGRPRTVYSPRQGMDRGGVRSYRLLAQILLSQLASSGPDAGEAVRQAGQDWGRYLVEPPPPHRVATAEEAAARLIALLGDLGFDPDPGAPGPTVPGVIRLRHCPFLELAEEYGPLVCQSHLGLMQGALHQLRAPVTAAGLVPFAEPGACLAHLSPVAA
ncbi:ArsR family transcriptional regulator [Streptacidiphilus pinicola]|uniref:ArsR family transcriptional regulator n=1 Tax=Streptacidiphilus pinicola TaxID=2219663 RepID=A0A2X0IED4_9ACTN|nr:ArsR family transcriptional regulator [Streptacidiphilus pinicola]